MCRLASEALLTTSPSVCESGKTGEPWKVLRLPEVAMELSFTATVLQRLHRVVRAKVAGRHNPHNAKFTLQMFSTIQ